MLIYRFTHPIKPIFVTMLCGLLAASASAYGRDNNSSDRNSGKTSASYKESAKDSTDGKRSKSYRSDERSAGAASTRSGAAEASKTYGSNTDQKGKIGSNDQQREDLRRAPKPAPSYRPDPKSAKHYPRTESWTTKNDNWNDKPKADARPTTDNNSYRYPGKGQVYTNNGRYDINNKSAKKFETTTYRGGRYYYSSRPSYKPCNYGYWSFDLSSQSRHSAYFHFGYFPYVQAARIHVTPYVSVGYRMSSDSYYLSKQKNSELNQTLADIRGAWMGGRFDLFRDHVNTYGSIAILLDGRYDYSLDSDDYVRMTADAVDQIQTISFTWQSIRQRTDGNYTALADHTYRDSAGYQKTVYVSYTFGRMGSGYKITEVGSSESRLSY